MHTGESPVVPGICRPDPSLFREEGGIWDKAIAPSDTSKSCISASGCHGQADGRSAFRLVAKARAELTEGDWAHNYDVVTRFLNCSTPEASSFVTKPLADIDSHAGGDLWTCDGTTCTPSEDVEDWIAGEP